MEGEMPKRVLLPVPDPAEALINGDDTEKEETPSQPARALPAKSFRMGEVDPKLYTLQRIPHAAVCIDITVGMEFRMYAEGSKIAEGDRFELATRLAFALTPGRWIEIKRRIENEDSTGLYLESGELECVQVDCGRVYDSRGTIVWADPPEADVELLNAADMEGKVCVFTSFDRPDLFQTVALVDRATRAYHAGAVACIVEWKDENLDNVDSMSSSRMPVPIPVIAVRKSASQKLQEGTGVVIKRTKDTNTVTAGDVVSFTEKTSDWIAADGTEMTSYTLVVGFSGCHKTLFANQSIELRSLPPGVEDKGGQLRAWELTRDVQMRRTAAKRRHQRLKEKAEEKARGEQAGGIRGELVTLSGGATGTGSAESERPGSSLHSSYESLARDVERRVRAPQSDSECHSGSG